MKSPTCAGGICDSAASQLTRNRRFCIRNWSGARDLNPGLTVPNCENSCLGIAETIDSSSILQTAACIASRFETFSRRITTRSTAPRTGGMRGAQPRSRPAGRNAAGGYIAIAAIGAKDRRHRVSTCEALFPAFLTRLRRPATSRSHAPAFDAPLIEPACQPNCEQSTYPDARRPFRRLREEGAGDGLRKTAGGRNPPKAVVMSINSRFSMD